MHAQASQTAELQKRRAPVEQARHPLARQQLATRLELAAFGFGFGNHQAFKPAHLGQQLGHALGIGGKGRAFGDDSGADDGHAACYCKRPGALA